MTSQDKYLALEKLMKRIAQSVSGAVAYGTAILAIISLEPAMQLPPAFAALVGGIGVNILSGILERIAKGEEISNDELLKQLDIATEDLKKTLTKEEFFNAYGHLLTKFEESHTEHKLIIQKIDNIVKIIDLNKNISAPPTNSIDAKGDNLQISTGENSRNIQAQIYIEKQIFQPKATSKRTKKENLNLVGGDNIEQKLSDGSRVRFLDALDSIRFSPESIYDDPRLLSVLYVKAQFFIALINGDSIVVTENQLFDSLGFLEAFDELCSAFEEVDAEVDVPVKVALRETNSDVFQAVANNIGNDSFVLTLWKDLKPNTKRRSLWAEHIRNKQKPTGDLVLEEERILLDKLWRALEYFMPNRCVKAKNIPDEFSRRINRAIDLTDEDLDDLYTGITQKYRKIKYFSSKDEIQAAKEIRDVLKKIRENTGEIKTRSQILLELKLPNYVGNDLREGVIEFTNSIYNQNLGIATEAKLIQSSIFPHTVNSFVIAGYALATYVHDTSSSQGSPQNYDVYSFDFFEDLEGLYINSRRSDLVLILETARNNVPWKELVEMQLKPNWRTSLVRFRDNLKKLQELEMAISIGSYTNTKREKLQKDRIDFQKRLGKSWAQHIANVSRRLANDFWDITPNEISLEHPSFHFPIRISYSFLKPKRDIEGNNEYKFWRSKPTFKGRIDGNFNPSK